MQAVNGRTTDAAEHARVLQSCKGQGWLQNCSKGTVSGRAPLTVSSPLNKAPVRRYFRNGNQRPLLLHPTTTAVYIKTGHKDSHEWCQASTSS